jgi:uncharacterized protein
MERAGAPAGRRRLIMAPSACALPASHWQREAIAFFDHIMQGAANGYALQAPVHYHHDGTDDYRAAHKVMVHAAMLQDIIW